MLAGGPIAELSLWALNMAQLQLPSGCQELVILQGTSQSLAPGWLSGPICLFLREGPHLITARGR